MPDNFSPYISLMLLGGVVSLVCGLLLFFLPPKNINWVYGYRTTRASKSEEAWRFAQSFSGKNLILSGFIFLILSPGEFIIEFDQRSGSIAGLILTLILLAIPVIRTEKQLKIRFDSTSNKATSEN